MAEKVYIPEVIEPDEKLPRDLVALRKFALLMDEAFAVPGTRMRVGLDAFLGLIPGIGDVIGGLFSTWIIAGALRHRVRSTVIVRMMLNVIMDVVLGSVPVAGDLFDFLYEVNMHNMRLLEKHRDRTRPPRSGQSIALILAAFIGVILIIGFILLTAAVALVLWLIGQRSWV